jgi:diguanylate cyclase (GGDEF)-like protein
MKRAESALRQKAMYDSLTALPNRLLFLERMRHGLETLMRRGAKRLGVLFCDIDSFKQVNDDHGHAVGDEVLVQITARLRQTLRPHDTVTQFGGDEFASWFTGSRTTASSRWWPAGCRER